MTATAPRRSLQSAAGTRRAHRSRLPLLTKVALALGAVALVPLGVVPVLVHLTLDVLSGQVQNMHALAVRSSAERAGTLLASLRTAAQTLAASPQIAADPRSDTARVLLAGLLQARRDVAAVAVVAKDGGEVLRVQARERDQAEAARELLALPDGDDLLVRRRADPSPSRADQTLLWARITAALPDGAGSLRVVADVSKLDELMQPEELGLGREANIALFDSRGLPVAGPEARADAFPARLLEAGRTRRLSGVPDLGGGDVVGACAPVPGTRWFVLSSQPVHVAQAAAERMRRLALLALGAALGLIALLSFGAYRTVILPLREVVQAQRRLIHGAGRVRSPDEIEQLRSSFALLEGEARDREAVGNVFLGRYLVVDVIASGGMGTVFRGWDPRLQRPVALKTVRFELAVPGARQGDLVSSLLNEAVTVARLNHPHIVAVYDVEDLPEAAFIAMEFVEGQSLADHMSDLGALPASRVVPLGAAIARGLAAAHARQVVHRDVKPANVLLGHDNAIKVTDFGIAGLLSSLAGPVNLVFGTPGYLPPEALRGEGQGAQGDLFALGVVLYEALVGDPLYWGDDLTVITKRTMEEPVVPLRERLGHVPPELDRLILALLEKRPAARPASAHDVAAELERLAAHAGWEWSMPPPLPGRERRAHESNSCFIPTLPDAHTTAKRGA